MLFPDKLLFSVKHLMCIPYFDVNRVNAGCKCTQYYNYNFIIHIFLCVALHGASLKNSTIKIISNVMHLSVKSLSQLFLFFIQKHMTTVWFINKFEGLCGSKASVQRLRSHPSFLSFMARWSLPVYFQIRLNKNIFY